MYMKEESISFRANNFIPFVIRTIFSRIWNSFLGRIFLIIYIVTIFSYFLSISSKLFQIFRIILMLSSISYIFFIPLILSVEEIFHTIAILKEKGGREFNLELTNICSSRGKVIYIKNFSVNFIGEVNSLEYIHFLGAGPLGAVFFLILFIFPSFLFFKLTNLKLVYLYVIYLPMLSILVNSLFIGENSDGKRAFKIAKKERMPLNKFLIEFFKGFFILIFGKRYQEVEKC